MKRDRLHELCLALQYTIVDSPKTYRSLLARRMIKAVLNDDLELAYSDVIRILPLLDSPATTETLKEFFDHPVLFEGGAVKWHGLT